MTQYTLDAILRNIYKILFVTTNYCVATKIWIENMIDTQLRKSIQSLPTISLHILAEHYGISDEDPIRQKYKDKEDKVNFR